MIKKLSVKNFKSIKELEIDCRKINLFIGEPNAGKSNILEALGLLSWCGHLEGDGVLRDYVRFEYAANLFYDNSTDEPVEIAVLRKPGVSASAKPDEDVLLGVQIAMRNEIFDLKTSLDNSLSGRISIKGSGEYDSASSTHERELRFVKFYRFGEREGSQGKEMSFLMPPHGSNLYRVVSTSKKLRENISTFFRDIGFKLMLRTATETFEFVKEIEDVLFNFPYVLLSDTLQRMIFHTVAMESNENSTLVFEEPESHAFPDDTHRLGKKIAFDKTNQYFIATHDPYLFLAILEKAPKEDVNVFITYARDYQTKVKCLDDEGMSEVMVYDPFANLDKLIGSLDSFVEEEVQ